MPATTNTASVQTESVTAGDLQSGDWIKCNTFIQITHVYGNAQTGMVSFVWDGKRDRLHHDEPIERAVRVMRYMRADQMMPGDHIFKYGRAGQRERVFNIDQPAGDAVVIHTDMTDHRVHPERVLLVAVQPFDSRLEPRAASPFHRADRDVADFDRDDNI